MVGSLMVVDNPWKCWLEDYPHIHNDINTYSAKEAAKLFVMELDVSDYSSSTINNGEIIVLVQTYDQTLAPQRFAVECELKVEYRVRLARKA
jgi:hypothetical protein